MGYWYLRPLKKEWAVNEATTNRFDLPERGMLSGLFVHLVVTNDECLEDVDNPWPFQNTDIRIVGNGNVELIDLRGRQLQAINHWESGEMPKDNLHSHDSGYTEQWAFIPFGRFMGDLKYGLDLSKFVAGVQFEETNVFATTHYQDGTEKYTIHALMRKNPEAGLFGGGFFKKRQIINKDTASETQYGVKLPTRNLLKQIHLFSEPDLSAHIPETNVYTNVNAIWLSIKSKEEYILDNINSREWATLIHQMYGRRAHTQIVAYGHGGGACMDPMIYEAEGRHCTAVHDSVAIYREDNATSWLERTADIYSYSAAGGDVDSRFYLDTWGMSYHGIIPLMMIHPLEDDEAKYLDSERDMDVYVEITEGASTGNWYVVLDELMKSYPS